MDIQEHTKEEMVNAFNKIGLQKGDSVIIHSAYRPLKPVKGGPMAVIDALLETIGPAGNLVLPTFNYSSPIPEPYFDPQETPCRTGIIPELGRQRPDAVRSLHPSHSVAVIGPDAEKITENHLKHRACGIGSPIDKLAKMRGKVLLIGVGHVTNTMIHLGEEYAEIPKGSYYDELPFFKIKMPDETIIEHQLDTSPSCSSAFGAAEEPLRMKGSIIDGKIGSCKLQLMKALDVVNGVKQLLECKADLLLCTRTECVPCSKARKSLCELGKI